MRKNIRMKIALIGFVMLCSCFLVHGLVMANGDVENTPGEQAEEPLKAWWQEQEEKMKKRRIQEQKTTKSENTKIPPLPGHDRPHKEREEHIVKYNLDVNLLDLHNMERLTFSDCCGHLTDIVSEQGPKIDNETHLSFAEYDFNDDGDTDFLSLIEGKMCEEALCPTFLFLKKQNGTYKKYDGPRIRANAVSVKNQKTDELHDIAFLSKSFGVCTWKWALGVNQNFVCRGSIP